MVKVELRGTLYMCRTQRSRSQLYLRVIVVVGHEAPLADLHVGGQPGSVVARRGLTAIFRFNHIPLSNTSTFQISKTPMSVTILLNPFITSQTN